MSKGFAARRLDVKNFAEESGVLNSQEPLANYGRLAAETQDGGAAWVAWTASGELRNAGNFQPQIWLHLKARTVLKLVCQRCLRPVELPLAVQRSFRFVADEKTAAAQDGESEEDVLALDHGFDLVGLVEDELLMELPLVAHHEGCKEPVKLEVADAGFDSAHVRRENPFAALDKLKTGRR